MKKVKLRLLFILFFGLLVFFSYEIYMSRRISSTETMNQLIIDKSSTKDWQNTAVIYMNKRNSIINSIIDGQYKGSNKWESDLRAFECAPILDGDIMLAKYILNNPGQYKDKTGYMNIEYSEIRKLTEDEVVMFAKVIYEKAGTSVRCDYEIAFGNNGGRWLLSRAAFAH